MLDLFTALTHGTKAPPYALAGHSALAGAGSIHRPQAGGVHVGQGPGGGGPHFGQAESEEQAQSMPFPQQVIPKCLQLLVQAAVQLQGSAGLVFGSVLDVTGSGAPLATDG